jgi:hypothetical protein
MSTQTSFKIYLVEGRAVSWYVTSQASNAHTLQITAPSGNRIVNTTVESQNLSNLSVGSLVVPQTGDYTVSFPGCNDVRQDTATITNQNGDTVCQTNQFAGEDGTDGDYNDVFACITWYRNDG